MKIVILQDRLRGGGTERQAVFLARAFAAAGESTTLLTFRPGGVLAAEAAATGVDHRALQPFDTGFDGFAPRLGPTLARLAPDVVLCLGRVANSRAGRIQESMPTTAVVATLRTGKRLPAAFRRALDVVRHVVANSEFARRTHAVPAGADGRCTVIPNALLFPALLAEAPPAAGPPRLLSSAQFRRGKGQRELIAACAALPAQLDWRMDFIGDGPERARCERAAARTHRAERFRFLGWQPDPVPFYRQAALAVLASRPGSESLPNFLVEAQCAGIPAVAGDVDGVGEALRHGVTGFLIPNGRPEAFTAAIAALLEDPARRAAMAAAARAFAGERFAPARVVAAYLGLFRRLRGET